MGRNPFGKKKQAEPEAAPPAPPAPEAPNADGPEKLTANEWAKKHNFNEVAAERAAMRAKKWHDLFTEEEFFELVRGRDI